MIPLVYGLSSFVYAASFPGNFEGRELNSPPVSWVIQNSGYYLGMELDSVRYPTVAAITADTPGEQVPNRLH